MHCCCQDKSLAKQKTKNKTKIREKMHCCCQDKSLVVKIDIVIFLSCFVERVSLILCLNVFKFVQRFS